MAYVLMPHRVRVPYMRADCDDYYRRTWTAQPGLKKPLLVEVEGPSDIEVPEAMLRHSKVDRLPTWNIPYGKDGTDFFKLRDYQEECVQTVLQSWASGMKSPLIVLPTGAGKTIIAAAIMDLSFANEGYRTVFLAHRQELLTQTIEKMQIVPSRAAPSIGLVQSKKNELRRDITVASIQTLGSSRGQRRRREFIDAGPYDRIIVDEAHHAVSPQYVRFLNEMKDAYPDIRILGMTATPGRADGTALDTVFDEIVFERNLLDMIKRGYLVPPKGYAVNLGLDLDRVRTSDGDYVRSQLSKLMNQPPVHRAVLEAWCKYGHNRKTIVFSVDVSHAENLAQEFCDAGYDAEHVHGKMGKRERNAVIKRFRDGETKVLTNCDIATEGFDEPSVEAILFARPTQSQGLYIQALGRGLRLHPGKTEALIIDCVGNSEKHRPVQLATLTGFDPEGSAGTGSSSGTGDSSDVPDLPDGQMSMVIGHDVTGTEVDLTSHQANTRYQWRETKLGWVLAIPRIGYYLVAWASKNRARCVIRFYDQRPGKKNTPAVDVVKDPIDFHMAYGLVEAEMDRIMNARFNRSVVRKRDGSTYEDPKAEDREFRQDDDSELPEVNFVDLDDGLSEQLDMPEELLLRDASWRSKKPTEKQKEFLLKLGVKQKSLPDTAGEASDLITILRIEKDAKMRLPATRKQIAYLKVNELPFGKDLTKGKASRMIWQHRKATGR